MFSRQLQGKFTKVYISTITYGVHPVHLAREPFSGHCHGHTTLRHPECPSSSWVFSPFVYVLEYKHSVC